MRLIVRRVLPLLAIAGITMAASCEPVKKAPLKDAPAGENIAYYFVENSGDPENFAFTRSPSPFSADVCQAGIKSTAGGGPGAHLPQRAAPLPRASQTLNDNGSVTLAFDFAGTGVGMCTPLTGFAVVVGRVANLETGTAGATPSSGVTLLLAFDVDADGNYTGDTSVGLGDDVLCTPGGTAAKISLPGPTIDDTTELTCFSAGGDAVRTLAELKAGVMGLGIDATTPVAMLIGLVSQNDATATVDSVTINGVEQL